MTLHELLRWGLRPLNYPWLIDCFYDMEVLVDGKRVELDEMVHDPESGMRTLYLVTSEEDE